MDKPIDANTIWEYYQSGINYKSNINLYSTVDRNERFYVGDQWIDANAPDLPKPVVNFIKRACQQKIANTMSNKTAVLFSSPNWPSQAPTETDIRKNIQNIAMLNNPNKPPDWQNPFLANEAECQLINAMFEMDWERLNMDAVCQEGLKDACISGDFILFNYWNDKAETGQAAKGNIEVEPIDNVNYYPGNPNQRDPQKQPYIIIARRELVSDVKAEAKLNKASQDDIKNIDSDQDYNYQSGDMAKKELQQDDTSKMITLMYLYRNPDTGTIWAQKCSRSAVIRKPWDTQLKRYPIALMNWELRKNSCHGRSEVQGLVPNQVSINKIFALIILYLLRNGSPKVIFSRSAGIQKWDNSVTRAIAVNSDVNAAAKYLQPSSMPSEMLNLPATLLKMTMEMIGTNDASLGNVNPTNGNAILLAKAQSEVPTQTVRNRFYAFIQDFALNWMDMTLAYFNSARWVEIVDNNGNKYPAAFDAEQFKNKVWSVKIDVGAANDWSQQLADQKYKDMVQSGQLDILTYIKMQPENVFNGRKDEIIKSIEDYRNQQQQQAMQQQAQKQGIVNQIPQMGGVQNGTGENVQGQIA